MCDKIFEETCVVVSGTVDMPLHLLIIVAVS